ncbi:hypothetical protein ANCDUO_21210 [Ancylostoma duodenale]|uniref:Uncharacterized protein n=1 Tax=Ancylostoma duodenale TaxID=51022 RepID=A0A0C2CFZ5_9BILA|nr:hypothetical protein ANCDUO_21210 [Ancylostoma duodenale]
MLTGDLPWDRAARSDPSYSMWLNGELPPSLRNVDRDALGGFY